MTTEIIEPTTLGEELERQLAGDTGVQASALAPGPGEPPPGFIRPPSLDSFANSTYLAVNDQIREIVGRVLLFPELDDLSGVAFTTLWRRQGRPGGQEKRRFAGVELVPAVVGWIAEHELEALHMPRYVLNLYWLHLDDLLEAQQYVHPTTLERHILDALLRVGVSETGVLSLVAVDPLEHAATLIKRYGYYDERVAAIHQQLALWPDPTE
jgi:hypothetical protein